MLNQTKTTHATPHVVPNAVFTLDIELSRIISTTPFVLHGSLDGRR
jgi:hypothetical protein